MPRLDVLKRIKDNVLIDEKIQILRLHFNYLKTALERGFDVDKSKYYYWNLSKVKTLSFDKWWKQIGKRILGRKLDAVKEVKSTSNRRSNTILVEIPIDNPAEYSIEKIRDIIQSKQSKDTSDERLHYVKLSIYLDAYKLRIVKGLQLKQVATELRKKRIDILRQRKSRSAMDRTRTEKFLSPSLGPESLQRQILRFRQKAEIILKNVCKGVFPGNYS